MAVYPLTNAISPNGDPLTISNATSTNGIVVINPGLTNLTFTATNLGVDTITYTLADAHGGTNSTTITELVTALADCLAVGKTAPSSVFAVSNLVYTITVTNFGPSPASSVTVTDAVPANTTFVSASAGGTTNNRIATWNLGTLNSNQVTSVTLTVTAPAERFAHEHRQRLSARRPLIRILPNNVTPPVVTSVTAARRPDDREDRARRNAVNAASNYQLHDFLVTNLGPSAREQCRRHRCLAGGRHLRQRFRERHEFQRQCSSLDLGNHDGITGDEPHLDCDRTRERRLADQYSERRLADGRHQCGQ